jgi:hypothetical protein
MLSRKDAPDSVPVSHQTCRGKKKEPEERRKGSEPASCSISRLLSISIVVDLRLVRNLMVSFCFVRGVLQRTIAAVWRPSAPVSFHSNKLRYSRSAYANTAMIGCGF